MTQYNAPAFPSRSGVRGVGDNRSIGRCCADRLCSVIGDAPVYIEIPRCRFDIDHTVSILATACMSVCTRMCYCKHLGLCFNDTRCLIFSYIIPQYFGGFWIICIILRLSEMPWILLKFNILYSAQLSRCIPISKNIFDMWTLHQILVHFVDRHSHKNYQANGWLVITSPKWPMLCRVRGIRIKP